MREAMLPIDQKSVDAVRGQTLEILDRLKASTAEFELPQPPDVLKMYRNKLQENRYLVLVAGEAKRGKSTFVNAVLGRNVLPTDVDIATCQVFCIRQAPKESYRVRFEDDSTQEITAADLPRFGSQALADSDNLPRLDRIIHWIEMEGPMQYLPKEIILLDTPGLGSLYAAHGRITGQFVPLADAVIFVLNSDGPIGHEEVQFLEKIVGVTRRIFFIQTMIDLYQREHWQAILTRNEQILAEKFGERLADNRIWPVSSTNLLKAAQTGDSDYEMVSKYRPLASALRSFLFRAAGWNRTADALLLSNAFQQETAKILTTRLGRLDSEPELNHTASRQRIVQQGKQFEQQWGECGYKRQELLSRLRQMTAEHKQEIRQALRTGCKIEVEQRDKIDGLVSTEQTKQLATAFSAQVVEAATASWQQVTKRFQSRCIELLRHFVEEAEIVSELQEDSSSDLAVRSGRGLDFGADPFLKIMVSADEFVNSSVLVAGAGCVLSIFVATSWFPPLAIASALAAGLWGAVRGWKLMENDQLQAARGMLHQHLDEVLQQMRSYFFENDVTMGHVTRVDHYFDSQVQLLTERIAMHAARKLEEAQAEIVRLEEEAGLGEVQRRGKAETLSRQIESWTQLGSEIAKAVKELDHLERLQMCPELVSAAAKEKR